MTALVRLAETKDILGILEIYNYEILNTTNTFDLVPKTYEQQLIWLRERSGVYPVLVADDSDKGFNNEILGFAALSPYRHRPAYSTTVENSIYVNRNHRRMGIGTLLINNLITRAKEHGFHSIIARITSENEQSLKLHENTGFNRVGCEVEIGRKFGKWIDVISYQKLL